MKKRRLRERRRAIDEKAFEAIFVRVIIIDGL